MTPPRCILPGATYLITRRCSERRFFLRPSRALNELLLFVLAVAAGRFGIQLHAFCVLSNHYHLVLTDVRGTLPEFQRLVDSFVARAVNAAIGHAGSFWDRESYSAIPLETAGDVLAKIVYVLSNPVAAGLVRNASAWPGAWSDPRQVGAPLRVERPRFFRAMGPLPAVAELVLQVPAGFENDPCFAATVERALRAREDRLASAHGRAGRGFLGVARVLAQAWWKSPVRQEPLGKLTPRVAGKKAWVRREALARLREFTAAYREALAHWRRGLRNVVFPAGTWAMRVNHGVTCAAFA
jgi:REP element-mobilizing transposase RayT